MSQNPYFGCVNGRCANRIKDGHFMLDGVKYQLAKNCPAGPNAVHGGLKVKTGIIQMPDTNKTVTPKSLL